MFSWGFLVPSESKRFISPKAPPNDVGFWSSKGLRIVHMSYGERFAAALDDRGGLWTWGGRAGPTPRQLPCRAQLSSLACTDSSLYAVTSRGKVLEWRDLAERLIAGYPLPTEPRPLEGALTNSGNPTKTIR